MVTDVALLPLSSKAEAHEAIIAATHAQSAGHPHSDSEPSDSEDDHHSLTATEHPGSPTEEDGPFKHENASNTSIAEDVAKRKASYGKFASQWFSKQVWGNNGPQKSTGKSVKVCSFSVNVNALTEPDRQAASLAVSTNSDSPRENAIKQDVTEGSSLVPNASTVSLLPKILRSTKMILGSRSFYFAYEFDLTRRFQLQEKRSQPAMRDGRELTVSRDSES